MEITYTLNNKVIFDINGKQLLKGVVAYLSVFVLILLLTGGNGLGSIEEVVKAYKMVY